MSSFKLNLSSLTLGAREHLARLEVGGTHLPTFLSPSQGFGIAGDPPPPSPSLRGLGPEATNALGGGVSGESLLSRGVPGGLSAFIMIPELYDGLCCDAVAGGVKFCTLGVGVCTFSTHSKKVVVVPDHLYVSTGCQSAFTHHHAPTTSLSSAQLSTLLKERHSREE